MSYYLNGSEEDDDFFAEYPAVNRLVEQDNLSESSAPDRSAEWYAGNYGDLTGLDLNTAPQPQLVQPVQQPQLVLPAIPGQQAQPVQPVQQVLPAHDGTLDGMLEASVADDEGQWYAILLQVLSHSDHKKALTDYYDDNVDKLGDYPKHNVCYCCTIANKLEITFPKDKEVVRSARRTRMQEHRAETVQHIEAFETISKNLLHLKNYLAICCKMQALQAELNLPKPEDNRIAENSNIDTFPLFYKPKYLKAAAGSKNFNIRWGSAKTELNRIMKGSIKKECSFCRSTVKPSSYYDDHMGSKKHRRKVGDFYDALLENCVGPDDDEAAKLLSAKEGKLTDDVLQGKSEADKQKMIKDKKKQFKTFLTYCQEFGQTMGKRHQNKKSSRICTLRLLDKKVPTMTDKGSDCDIITRYMAFITGPKRVAAYKIRNENDTVEQLAAKLGELSVFKRKEQAKKDLGRNRVVGYAYLEKNGSKSPRKADVGAPRARRGQRRAKNVSRSDSSDEEEKPYDSDDDDATAYSGSSRGSGRPARGRTVPHKSGKEESSETYSSEEDDESEYSETQVQKAKRGGKGKKASAVTRKGVPAVVVPAAPSRSVVRGVVNKRGKTKNKSGGRSKAKPKPVLSVVPVTRSGETGPSIVPRDVGENQSGQKALLEVYPDMGVDDGLQPVSNNPNSLDLLGGYEPGVGDQNSLGLLGDYEPNVDFSKLDFLDQPFEM